MCLGQTINHACLVQETVHEAICFMWALVRYNPRMVSAFTTCNMEAPNAPQSSSGNPRDWLATLVSLSPQMCYANEPLTGSSYKFRVP